MQRYMYTSGSIACDCIFYEPNCTFLILLLKLPCDEGTLCSFCLSEVCLVLCVCFRPGRTGANATGRGVLSMQALSHGVVRVDNENSLTSLTLQDCGQVLPGGMYI